MSNKMQWVKGEKLGKIETVVDVDGEWTVFEDGGRINSNLINEFKVNSVFPSISKIGETTNLLGKVPPPIRLSPFTI